MKFKNIVILLFVFVISVLPAFGNIEIFGSVYGAMSDPGSWKEFSCIMSNGELNKLKWQDYMRTFKTYGATSTRECPFLLHADQPTINPGYMPFEIRDGLYDLDKFNPVYFKNLGEMARIANGEGIVFYFSLFGPHCNFPTSPWCLNHQGITGTYDESLNAYNYRLIWANKVIETLKGYEVGCQLFHDPTDIRYANIAPGIIDLLLKCGIPKERIILGVSYSRKKLNQDLKRLLKYNQNWDSRRIFSRFAYDINLKFFYDNWPWQKQWTRTFISDYELQPKKSAKYWNNVLKEWFRIVKLKKNKYFKTHSAFEHIYRYPGDDITGVYGIASAVEKAYGIKMYIRGPMFSETVFSQAGWRNVDFSDDAACFSIKVKGKWYEVVWKILKAIWEVLTGKE